jgi:transposase
LKRSSPTAALQEHVWRATVILATADGCGTAEIMRRSGKSKPVVGRWQARFMAEGVEGLTGEKTRKPGKERLRPFHNKQTISRMPGSAQTQINSPL